MKKSSLIVLAILLVSSVLSAAVGYADEIIAGPKGGRILEHTNPQAEFLLEKDRTVTIAFYDKELNPVSAESQNAVVNTEKDGIKTKIEFEKKGDVLISKGQLPEGSLNIVVQFKQTPDTKPVNFRFPLDEGICGECKRAEYACICEH